MRRLVSRMKKEVVAMPISRVAFKCQRARRKTLHTFEVSTFSQDSVDSMIASKTLKHVDPMISTAE